ncbi:unnamed protein product [Meloidogyne enterolobii]|uniref:Uncharacterized protein n=1 Tax=Meloidogyne enterolobii TaxID=390850 RepID=A0ACB0ZE73_MELEN
MVDFYRQLSLFTMGFNKFVNGGFFENGGFSQTSEPFYNGGFNKFANGGFEALSETSNKITTNEENIEESNNEENIDESM